MGVNPAPVRQPTLRLLVSKRKIPTLDVADLKKGVHLPSKQSPTANALPVPDAHHPNHRHILKCVCNHAKAHDACFGIRCLLVLRGVPAIKSSEPLSRDPDVRSNLHSRRAMYQSQTGHESVRRPVQDHGSQKEENRAAQSSRNREWRQARQEPPKATGRSSLAGSQHMPHHSSVYCIAVHPPDSLEVTATVFSCYVPRIYTLTKDD